MVRILKAKSIWEAMNGIIQNPEWVSKKLNQANLPDSQNNDSDGSEDNDEDVDPELYKKLLASGSGASLSSSSRRQIDQPVS